MWVWQRDCNSLLVYRRLGSETFAIGTTPVTDVRCRREVEKALAIAGEIGEPLLVTDPVRTINHEGFNYCKAGRVSFDLGSSQFSRRNNVGVTENTRRQGRLFP